MFSCYRYCQGTRGSGITAFRGLIVKFSETCEAGLRKEGWEKIFGFHYRGWTNEYRELLVLISRKGVSPWVGEGVGFPATKTCVLHFLLDPSSWLLYIYTHPHPHTLRGGGCHLQSSHPKSPGDLSTSPKPSYNLPTSIIPSPTWSEQACPLVMIDYYCLIYGYFKG